MSFANKLFKFGLAQSNLLRLRKLENVKLPSVTTIRWGSDSAAYQGDGKTTVRILNDEEPYLNMINSYSAKGFRISKDLFIAGSILLFPTHVYSWSVREAKDITPESLVVFDLIVPKTKIVVIGYGEPGEKYDASIPMKLKQKGISCEMLPTPSAVTTYNYLVSDSVHVAGAFVVVKQRINTTDKDESASSYIKEYVRGGPYGARSRQLDDEYIEESYEHRQKLATNEKKLDPNRFEP